MNPSRYQALLGFRRPLQVRLEQLTQQLHHTRTPTHSRPTCSTFPASRGLRQGVSSVRCMLIRQFRCYGAVHRIVVARFPEPKSSLQVTQPVFCRNHSHPHQETHQLRPMPYVHVGHRLFMRWLSGCRVAIRIAVDITTAIFMRSSCLIAHDCIAFCPLYVSGYESIEEKSHHPVSVLWRCQS